MKLITRFCAGSLPAALDYINERDWVSQVFSIVPGVERLPIAAVVDGETRSMGTSPVEGHYIVLRVTHMHARLIEREFPQ